MTDDRIPVCRLCGVEKVSVPMDIGAYDWLCPVCELGPGPVTVKKDLRKLRKWIDNTYGSPDKMLTWCYFNKLDWRRESGMKPYPKGDMEMASFEMHDFLRAARHRNRWQVSNRSLWNIVEKANLLDYPPEVWCHNCNTLYREEDLELMEDHNGYFHGCPKCNTDEFLMNFAELDEEKREILLKQWKN